MSGIPRHIVQEAADIVAALDAIECVISSEDVQHYRDLTERAVELVRDMVEVLG